MPSKPDLDRIERIRKWYAKNDVPVAEIARAFNTSSGAIFKLARKYQWPPRVKQ